MADKNEERKLIAEGSKALRDVATSKEDGFHYAFIAVMGTTSFMFLVGLGIETFVTTLPSELITWLFFQILASVAAHLATSSRASDHFRQIKQLSRAALDNNIELNWVETSALSKPHIEILGRHSLKTLEEIILSQSKFKLSAPDMNIYGPVSASELIEIVEKRQLSNKSPQDELQTYEPATNEQVVGESNQPDTKGLEEPQNPAKPTEIQPATNIGPAPRPSGLGANNKLAVKLAATTDVTTTNQTLGR